MNEVKKCSISGIAFTISTDAHAALQRYLDTLQKRYGNEPDGGEIIADIEAHIAEMILSAQDNSRVVELPLVEQIISNLGSADAISEESDTEGEPTSRKGERHPRRLYRDMEHAKLGGVCAGIARFFNVDCVWIRLAIFAPLILTPFACISVIGGNIFAVFVLTYLVLWFSTPAARTPRQKLEMMGKRITEQNIREGAAASNPNDSDTAARPIIARFVETFGTFMLIMLKIVAAFVIFGLTMAILALIIGSIALAVVGGEWVDTGSMDALLTLTNNEIALTVLGILTVLIPAALLLYLLITLVIGRRPNGKVSAAIFVLWILIFIALCITSIKNANTILSMSSIDYSDNRIEQIGDVIEARIEQISEQIETKVEQIESQVEKIEEAVEQRVEQTIENVESGSPSIDPTFSLSDEVKNGGTFRHTEINIDK